MESIVKNNQDFGEINVTLQSQVSDHHARGLSSVGMKTKQNYYEVLGEEIVIKLAIEKKYAEVGYLSQNPAADSRF